MRTHIRTGLFGLVFQIPAKFAAKLLFGPFSKQNKQNSLRKDNECEALDANSLLTISREFLARSSELMNLRSDEILEVHAVGVRRYETA